MRDPVTINLMLMLALNLALYGQNEFIRSKNNDLNRDVNFLNTDEGQFSEETAQHWLNLRENPLDLNKITKEELLSLSLLSISQINNFIQYIKIHGQLISIYELQAIPEFDIPTIRKILPLVTLAATAGNHIRGPLTKRILGSENHYLVLRLNKTLEKKSGFAKPGEPAFTGSPYQWLVKYRSSRSKDFSVGLTMEKDAGERFIWQPGRLQYGPDFWSFHFALKNKGKLKNLTIGDYKLQLGQGVLFAAGFYPGKGSETITITRRSNLGIVPYTSSAENGFLRGVAATYEMGQFDITAFYSTKLLDANLKFDSLKTAFLISSLQQSGLHRTAREISQRKSVREQVGGININYLSRNKSLTLGQVFSLHHYNLVPLESDRLYKKFARDDNLAMHLGYNFGYNWENFHFFGEGVLANTGKYGLVLGLMANFSAKVQSSLLFRKYVPGFEAPFGDAFSENTVNSNESGFYWGLKLLPSRRFTITAFIDIFRFPWLKFGVDRPSEGDEQLLAITCKLSKHSKITGLLRHENKATNYDKPGAKLNSSVTRQRKNYQLSFSNEMSDRLTLKTNLQWSRFKKASDESGGFSISQDLNITWGPFRLSNRIMLFDTQNADNRHYRYERDLLYALSIPAFSGSGYRYYTLFQAKIARYLSLWIKFARTIYTDRLIIGSGAEQIDAPKKTDVRCQVRYRF